MHIRMNVRQATEGQRQRRSLSILTRLTAVMILIALLWSPLGGNGIAAAATTVTSVKLDDLTPSQTTVYVEDGSLILMMWATTTDGTNSSTSNVTNDATWVSSNSAISVSKGVVTATGEASNVVITGKYQGYSASVTLNAKFHYSELKLRLDGQSTDAADKMDILLGKELSLDAIGVNDSVLDDLTSKATWTSSNTAVASVDAGVVTLNAAGKTTITAKYQGRTDTIVLTVTSPYKSLAILDQAKDGKTGPYEMQVGEDNKQLYAFATLTSGAIQTLTDATWTSSNTAVATVDENGAVTPVGAGTATITASSLGVTRTETVAVRTPYEAIQFTPSDSQYLPLQGGTIDVTAIAVNGKEKNVTLSGAVWESSNLQILSVSGTDAKAVITPRGEGTAKVKITYKGMVKELSVTVFPSVSEIAINKEKLEVFVDDTDTMPTVKGTKLDGNTVDISKLATWTSSDSSVISVGVDGKWTALKTGTATLTATVSNGSGAAVTNTIVVTVSRKPLTLLPDTDNMSLVIGKETDLPKVQVVYEDGTEDDISSLIVWKSASTSLLVKDAKLKGLLAVKTTLTGTYLNKTVKVAVLVEEEYTSFVIEPAALSLTLNKSQSIKVTGKTKSGKLVNLSSRMEWTSSDETVVTVKGSTAKSGTVESSAKLTATLQGKSLTLPVTVKAKLSKLVVSDSSLTLATGASDNVTVTAVYENGRTLDVTAYSAWTASSTKVAKVYSGTITALGKGSVSIKASYGGKTASVRVKVN